MIDDIFSSYRGKYTGHLELRAQSNSTSTITMTNGNIVTNTHEEMDGVFARKYQNGVFGACSAAGFSPDAIRTVLDGANENASHLAECLLAHGGELPRIRRGDMKHNTQSRMGAQKQYLDFLRELDDHIARRFADKGISSRTIILREESYETRLMVADGFDNHSLLPRSHVMVRLITMDKHGKPVDLLTVMGGGNWFADTFVSAHAFDAQLDRLYEQLMEKREGIYAQAGVHDIILDSSLVGLLAHEAIGHTTESDLVRGGSIAGLMLNKRVASEMISLTDFAHTAFGQAVPLPIHVDDEGTPGGDVEIIKDGILSGYMCNRRDAERLGITPRGNARAFSYKDEPLVRMRNTCILPGTNKFSDMISAIDRGYYLQSWSNGQADTTSEFMFGVTMGYEIVNGKLGRAIRDTTLSGVAFDMLQTVDMVGDTIEWVSFGMCGKKQPIANAMGGPALKCRASIGGR